MRVSAGKGKSRQPQAIYLVEHLDFDDAGMVFEQACAIGCEGMKIGMTGATLDRQACSTPPRSSAF